MTDDPKMPEPVAYVDDLSRPQPHCVTSLKYCSVLQHQRGDHLRYTQVVTRESAQAYAEALAAARVAQERERMVADGWRQTRYVAPVTDCEACLTPDACAIREQCGHYLRERDRDTQPPADNRLLMRAFEAAHQRQRPIPPDINAVLHAHLGTLYIEDDQPPETGKGQ